MSRVKKLLYDTSLYSVAQFSSSGLQLLALPIYTRHFSPTTFGTWDLILAMMTMLVPIISLELSSATYRWLLDDTATDSKETIIATGWKQLIQNCIIFTLGTIVIGFFIHIPYILEIIVMMNLLVIHQFSQQCARGLQQNKLFALLLFLPTALTIAFIILSIVYFPLGIQAFFYGNIVALVMTIIIAWQGLDFQQYMKHPGKHTLLKSYLAYALPIIPAAISWMMMTMIDRVIIAIFLGVEANGIYAIALKIPAILLLFNTVFSLAWKDNVLTFFHTKNNQTFFMKTYLYYALFLGGILITLIVLAKPIILIAIGDAFHDAWKYSIILLFAVFFQSLSLFWAAIFHGAKRTKVIFYSTIVGVICNLLLNLMLVKPFGLYGVAGASVGAFAVMWGVREVWGRRVIGD